MRKKKLLMIILPCILFAFTGCSTSKTARAHHQTPVIARKKMPVMNKQPSSKQQEKQTDVRETEVSEDTKRMLTKSPVETMEDRIAQETELGIELLATAAGEEDDREEEEISGTREEEEEEEEEDTIVTDTSKIRYVTKPAVEVSNPQEPYYIRINRQSNCVTVYNRDETGEFTIPVKAMVCSAGLDGETPLGQFQISQKYEWRYLFGNVYGQYAIRFHGHILFHSVPYTAQDKGTLKAGQYNKLGEFASMGCIRLSVADAKWLCDHCPVGTGVEVYDNTNPGPMGKPLAIRVSEDSPFRGWDPTDPDINNPWTGRLPTLVNVQNMVVERGATINLLEHVDAIDYNGTYLLVSVTGAVDTTVCGEYAVTYSATGEFGATVYDTATVKVVESLE